MDLYLRFLKLLRRGYLYQSAQYDLWNEDVVQMFSHSDFVITFDEISAHRMRFRPEVWINQFRRYQTKWATRCPINDQWKYELACFCNDSRRYEFLAVELNISMIFYCIYIFFPFPLISGRSSATIGISANWNSIQLSSVNGRSVLHYMLLSTLLCCYSFCRYQIVCWPLHICWRSLRYIQHISPRCFRGCSWCKNTDYP